MNNSFNNNENKPLTNKIKETTNKTMKYASNSLNTLKDVGQRTANKVSSEYQKTKSKIQNAANSSKTYQSVKRGTSYFSSFAQDLPRKIARFPNLCLYYSSLFSLVF